MPKQIEMDGVVSELEHALNDLNEMLDDADKLKETIPLAKERVAKMMRTHRKDSIRHGGRTFIFVEGKITEDKIRVAKREV